MPITRRKAVRMRRYANAAYRMARQPSVRKTLSLREIIGTQVMLEQIGSSRRLCEVYGITGFDDRKHAAIRAAYAEAMR